MVKKRYYANPSKRAGRYADELRCRQHFYGHKRGFRLTDYEAGLRSGYLQAQSDHANMWKYNQSMKNRYLINI